MSNCHEPDDDFDEEDICADCQKQKRMRHYGMLSEAEVKLFNELQETTKQLEHLKGKHQVMFDAFWSQVRLSRKLFDANTLSVDPKTGELLVEEADNE